MNNMLRLPKSDCNFDPSKSHQNLHNHRIHHYGTYIRYCWNIFIDPDSRSVFENQIWYYKIES